MGKKTPKNKTGEAAKYYSRNQAIKKLQISLKQFRKLCILKGIYPVEPSNKKIYKKSTQLKTFYYKKDIAFLAHEPLLETLRKEEIYKKKLGKLLFKKEDKAVEVLQEQKPIFKLDHLVKERYPSFEDALKDMDDCLSMVALFSTLNSDVVDNENGIFESQRLISEFIEYVVLSHSLRKVFLSIKGIYYQVVIKGVTITWIAPYEFSMDMPHDVDFKVMNTFLDFNMTLLGFVNYKLFTELGLIYPPVLGPIEVSGQSEHVNVINF
jgi:pescadillo protein